MFTLEFEKEFSCHLSTLERQFHITYSFWEAFKRAYIYKALDHLFNIYTFYLKRICLLLMQSYPARALDRRLKVDWARDPREGPRVLMSLRVDFEPMG